MDQPRVQKSPINSESGIPFNFAVCSYFRFATFYRVYVTQNITAYIHNIIFLALCMAFLVMGVEAKLPCGLLNAAAIWQRNSRLNNAQIEGKLLHYIDQTFDHV